MTSRVSRAPARSWLRLALFPFHVLSRFGRMFLLALAGAFGGPPPKPPRHEDDVVQVAEDA
jgi:hypothetical protein